MKNSKHLSAVILCSVAILLSCEEGMNLESPTSSELNAISVDENADAQSLITNYSFSGQEGDAIPLETAQRWTSKYREINPSATKAHFFGHEILKQILAEKECVGIRMYYALDDDGKRQIVLVGVNSAGENLLPQSLTLDGEDGNIVADASFPCPSFCPPGSEL
ncbi:MAG: hypothetical protein ABL895_10105 [Cyclobacteriaceae bacterium]